MKSVSEVGFDLSVIKWKPITPEQFAGRIDDASIESELTDEFELTDDFGNGTIHVKSAMHGQDVITIYYIKKGPNSAVWRPFAMTWRTSNKWLRFEFIGG